MIAATEQGIVERNEALRQEFARRGLDPAPVCGESAGDPEGENWRLRRLLDWVKAYRRFPDRRALERRGFTFPPVEPDCDPESDWERFERWVTGRPLTWNFVREFGDLPDADSLTDTQVSAELARITERLAGRGVVFALEDGIPPRPRYDYLRKTLHETDFDFLPPGTTCLMGECGGYCPDCFQRPWCDLGQEWDDAEAQPAP